MGPRGVVPKSSRRGGGQARVPSGPHSLRRAGALHAAQTPNHERRPRGARSKLQTPNGTSVGRVVHQSCKNDCVDEGGYPQSVDESSGHCAFPLCSRSASVTLQLLVEEDASVLAACDRHADWLRRYVQEDDAVRVVDEVPQGPAERFGEDDLADLA